jgi:hypothetical protein
MNYRNSCLRHYNFCFLLMKLSLWFILLFGYCSVCAVTVSFYTRSPIFTVFLFYTTGMLFYLTIRTTRHSDRFTWRRSTQRYSLLKLAANCCPLVLVRCIAVNTVFLLSILNYRRLSLSTKIHVTLDKRLVRYMWKEGRNKGRTSQAAGQGSCL